MANRGALKATVAEIRRAKMADGGDVADTSPIGIVQEANNVEQLVKNNAPLSAYPQTPGETVGAALSTATGGAGEAAEEPQGPLAEAQRALGYPVTPRGATMPSQDAYELLQDTQRSVGKNGITPDHVQAAQEHYSRAKYFEDRLKLQKKARRGYADGGDVMPAVAATTPSPQQDAPAMQAASGVNVINPEGTLVSIPADSLEDALNNGYQQATPDQVEAYAKQQQYGTLLEQAKTIAEGLSQGIAGPLAAEAEVGLGGSPEAMRARREVNPGEFYGSQAAGLIGGALTGTGEGALIEEAGKGITEGLGMAGAESALGRIGSAATRGAIENMMIQSGDEATKMIMQDPNQSAQTALTDIGLSGLIGGAWGGALGSAAPIWDAASQSHLGKMLHLVSSKTGGIEGVAPDEISRAIQESGLDVPAEVVSGLSNDPSIRHMFASLQEASTSSGLKAQEALRQFRQRASNAIVEALGRSPEDVAGLEDLSTYDAGQALKKTLKDELKATMEPIANEFEAVKNKFKDTELPSEAKGDIATKIAQLSDTQGYGLDPKGPQAGLINRALGMIENMKTLEDVRKAGSVIDDVAKQPELWRVGGQIKRIFRDTEESILDQKITEGMAANPELTDDTVARHKLARAAYKKAMDTIDALNDRLHVGRYNGPGSFISALDEMSPEDVIRRLSPKNDAGIIGELEQKFPNSAEQLKNYHLDQVLKQAGDKAGPGEAVSSKQFYNAISKMSPEMRQFVVPQASMSRLNAIQKLLEALPSKMNTSGTAKTLDSLWGHVPASAIGLATMLTEHSPVTGLLVGGIAKALSRDIPDAIKLSLLKFLGSKEAINPEGFKSMVNFVHSTMQGEKILTKGVNAVFKAGAEVLPESRQPSDISRARLEKAVKEYQQNPQKLIGIGVATGHYMPGHAQSMSATAASALGYLASQRPVSEPQNPLDSKIPPNSIQKSNYNRALDIAQQPMIVLQKIKQGTLTVQDVTTLKSLYPALYSRMVQKLTMEVMNQVDKKIPVPYSTRLQLSVLLGQPLDSTMTPQAILSAQIPNMANRQPAGGPAPKKSTEKLGGISKSAMTNTQNREAARAGQQKD